MNNNLLTITNINQYIKSGKILWTKHCLNRLNQRGILTIDVKQSINNGSIIEYYYEDYPYPSCLILGRTLNHKKLHIVCGISNNLLYIITAYYPDNVNWSLNMKKRRQKNGLF